jgi:hypothetical protein
MLNAPAAEIVHFVETQSKPTLNEMVVAADATMAVASVVAL